jgi:hypothetical protein
MPPPTPVGSASIPPPQAAATTAAAGKQGVPCVFFQKGYCLKGDRCPFFHPQFTSSRPVPTLSATTPVNDQHALQKSSTGIEKPKQVQKAPQVNVSKPVELPAQSKPTIRLETKFSSSNGASDKYVPPVSAMYNEQQPPNYRSTNVPLTTTQSDSINRTNNRAYQPHVSEDNSTLHYKDLDEFSRDPSPGFDVLVDDHRDSDYYPNNDQFGRARGHEGRNLKAIHDYEIGRSSEYNMMADVDRDLYRDPRSYERHQYGWEEPRLSSERAVAPPLRRHNPRSVDSSEDSDLRNVLAKQRRGNDGLRSAVSRDHPRGEDRNYRPPARREAPHKESSVGSRLRGRIKMPGRSISPVNEERGRTRVRYSPEMQPIVSSQQGRLKDRIKGRVEDDFSSDGGRGLLGPKRLSDDSLSFGKRKFPHNQQSDGGVSFEGPKPLSEILKRKRGSESSGLVSDVKESKMRSTVSTKSVDDQEPVQEKVKALDGESSLQRNPSDEEGMINEDEREEGYVEGGEYEDEQAYEEEEYNENAVAAVADLEEEYIEEEEEADDEDDFAKKMGVMYS